MAKWGNIFPAMKRKIAGSGKAKSKHCLLDALSGSADRRLCFLCSVYCSLPRSIGKRCGDEILAVTGSELCKQCASNASAKSEGAKKRRGDETGDKELTKREKINNKKKTKRGEEESDAKKERGEKKMNLHPSYLFSSDSSFFAMTSVCSHRFCQLGKNEKKNEGEEECLSVIYIAIAHIMK